MNEENSFARVVIEGQNLPPFLARAFEVEEKALKIEKVEEEGFDTVSFLSGKVAGWFVRSQNNFHCVENLSSRLTKRDVQRMTVARVRRCFPDLAVDENVWRQVFKRAIEETHDDPSQSIPIWNGSTRCCPGLSTAIVPSGEMVSVNTWQLPRYRQIGETVGDIGMFDEFLVRIFPYEVDRHVFKDWLSWCLQNEADKPAWAPFLYSRRKGTGKSTLCQLVVKLFGDENSITQNSIEKLTGRFNKPLLDSKLVVSEELQLKPNSSRGNTLKTYISEKVTTSEVKGREVEKVRQHCCFLFTTNHLPLWIEADERRYYVIDVDHDGSASGPNAAEFGAFVAEFVAWMDNDENIARLYNALLQHRQSNSFNPRALNLSAIDTPVMQQIMGASREVSLVRLEEWLAEQGVFALPQERIAFFFVETLRTNQNRIRHMMPELRWRPVSVKWGGVDHARVVWVHADYQVAGGRVRGPEGYDQPIEAEGVLL
ncbi:primase-helicase family protein [Sulfitobacter dubius]|uniref:primase-helicase family protein n=1 Tax=Sulfitobacter dubius TaxID=218673 RepID=UPI002943B671|nr:DUF5906 domain-containing protein [Sulfitobacter dubius]WOI28725.1 DUF5906 domain-containing protein [Sulfitobacter dubius]